MVLEDIACQHFNLVLAGSPSLISLLMLTEASVTGIAAVLTFVDLLRRHTGTGTITTVK